MTMALYLIYQNLGGYLFNIINERERSGTVNMTTFVNTNINYEPVKYLKL